MLNFGGCCLKFQKKILIQGPWLLVRYPRLTISLNGNGYEFGHTCGGRVEIGHNIA